MEKSGSRFVCRMVKLLEVKIVIHFLNFHLTLFFCNVKVMLCNVKTMLKNVYRCIVIKK